MFSRPEKVTAGREGGTYVQGRLWDERDEVRGLVENGAMFDVCGSRAVADGTERVMKGRLQIAGYDALFAQFERVCERHDVFEEKEIR